MEGTDFDEIGFFRALARARDEGAVRALLIGRRALVILGLPVLTADYDFWAAPTDLAALNELASPFGLIPSRTPEEVRKIGRYVLENDEHVDVLATASISTATGTRLVFEDLWSRRALIELEPGVEVALPSLDDLIATKQIKPRAKDLEDVALLETLRRRQT
jgi:hypothetical protein